MLVVGNWNLGRNRFTEQWPVETVSLPETAGGKPRFQDRLPHHQICDASSAAGPEPFQWFSGSALPVMMTEAWTLASVSSSFTSVGAFGGEAVTTIVTAYVVVGFVGGLPGFRLNLTLPESSRCLV